MLKIVRFIKRFLTIEVVALLLGFYFLSRIFKKKDEQKRSDDPVIDSAIIKIDSAFNALGTFDSDVLPVLNILKSLTGSQIVKLHEDFGIRYYNSLTGKYKLLDTGSYGGLTQKHNLSSLYVKEFSSAQIEILKKIYFDKGLAYPFVI